MYKREVVRRRSRGFVVDRLIDWLIQGNFMVFFVIFSILRGYKLFKRLFWYGYSFKDVLVFDVLFLIDF